MALIDQAAALQKKPILPPGTPPATSPGAAQDAPDDAPDDDGDAASEPDDDEDDQGGGGQPITEQDLDGMQSALEAKIPPEMQDAFKRVTLAGQKVLYSPETSSMLKEQIQGQGEIDQKLASGAAGLMNLLNQQAQGKIPPPVYIPAGAWLLLDMAEAWVRAKQPITDQDVRDGLDQFSSAVMAKHGASPDQVAQTVGGQQAPDAAPDAAPQPGAPA